MTTSQAPLYPELLGSIERATAEVDQIPEDRRARLREIAGYVRSRVEAAEPARLVFICTHNSRRSHMAQLWAQTAARYFGVANVETFSGGTEATAFNPRAVAALRRAGFTIEPATDTDNPVYTIRTHDDAPVIEAFSKKYDAPPNPTDGFAAIMTCSQADEACPLVLGATARIATPYDDPKAADGSGHEAATYDERCREIAREMVYVFSLIER